MIAIALPMPSACTTRFCASRCSISISVCFRSRTFVAAIFSATASATSFGYWMLPTTALMTAKGVSLVSPHALGDRVADLRDPVLDLEPVQFLDLVARVGAQRLAQEV